GCGARSSHHRGEPTGSPLCLRSATPLQVPRMANVEAAETGPLGMHGASVLPEVEVDTYNEELRDADGFLGDRASKRAFNAIVDDWRTRPAKVGDDPPGDNPTQEPRQ